MYAALEPRAFHVLSFHFFPAQFTSGTLWIMLLRRWRMLKGWLQDRCKIYWSDPAANGENIGQLPMKFHVQVICTCIHACIYNYRTMPISLFVGIPVVTVCYLLVNVSFFLVLSYEEILSAKAVALVSWTVTCIIIKWSVENILCTVYIYMYVYVETFNKKNIFTFQYCDVLYFLAAIWWCHTG